MNTEQLLEVGRKAVNHAQNQGAQEAEAFVFTKNLASVKFAGGIFASRGGTVKGIKGSFVRIAEPWIKKKGIPMMTSGVKAGVGVRAEINKAIGFSSVSSIEEKKVLGAAEEAVRIAKIRPPDPNWVSLPEAKKPIGQAGVFDKKVSDLEIQKMLDLCVDCCVTAGDADKRITQAMAMVSADSVAACIVNTRGIEVSDQGTFFTVFVVTKGKSGSEEVSSSDFLFSRTYSEELRPIAASSAKRTIECFGRKPLPQKHVGQVVFENVSWNELFSVIFTSGISALNVQENRSPLKEKLEKQVAKEIVSVFDDGTLPNGFGTSLMDDEGVPTQKTSVVENGVLRSFLYDNYSARREERESTGNASRNRFSGASPYASQPVIRPTNLELMPGKGNLDALVSEVKDGVLVKGSLIGAFHSNTVTGDFSVTAENAFKIENGVVAYPLKPCTVAGNLYKALNSVVAIGNDSKSVQNFFCPSVVIDGIVVAT